MKYSIILADLDNTLFDFNAGEAEALPEVFKNFGYEYSDDVKEIYINENTALWHSYERGEINLDHVLDNRFYLTMKHFGKEINGREWDVFYRGLLCGCAQLMIGATEFCRHIHASGTHRLYAVTNGIEKTQVSRLEKSGLAPYFDGVFTSERIGVRKPDLEFFEYVAKAIPDFDKSRTLVIGDSPSTDISGGKSFGVDTCLVTWGKSIKCEAATFKAENLDDVEKICFSE